MKRLLASATALYLVSCAPGLGGPRPVDVPTVAFLADAAADAAEVGAAVRDVRSRIALVAGPADAAWHGAVSAASGLAHVSGPGVLAPDLAVAFLGMEAVGDTTIELSFDGGRFILHDALYDLGNRHFLDLLAFRVEQPATVRPLITALTEYVATDVMPGAAVIFAVVVPDPATGDSVGRLLSPMYRGAAHCGAPPERVARSEIRVFYGPEARMFCRSATVTELAQGDRVHAELVAGRR
jgi:hypothetical protein